MKIGILQYNPEFGRIENNLNRVAQLVANKDADLFVLPELFATGYIFQNKDELSEYAERPGKGLTGEFLARLAVDKEAAFIGGYPERADEGIYNSAIFFGPEGETHNYRKIHLFDREKIMFEPGDSPFEVFEYRGAKIGMMICFDWIFPESYRSLALKGADIICHSTNLVLPYCQRAAYAHAVSNRVFIVLSNRTGSEKRAGHKLTFTGQSIAYSPGGQVLCDFDAIEESVKIIEIDPKAARAKFVTERNNVITDRRPNLYEM